MENEYKCVHAWPEMEERRRPAGQVHGCLKSQLYSGVKMCFYNRFSPEALEVLKWVVLPLTWLCSVIVHVLPCF